MRQVDINTAHNVTIELKTANFGQRLGAYLVDGIAVLIGGVIITLITTLLVTILASAFNIDPATRGYISMTLLVAFYAVYCTYGLWMPYFFDGQTLGKMAFGIRIIQLDGQPATFFNLFIRWIMLYIETAISFGLAPVIAILVSKKHQRLGDMAAGTIVVHSSKSVYLSDIYVHNAGDSSNVFHSEQQSTQNSYDASKLTAYDISVIQELLDRADRDSSNEATNASIQRVATQIALKLEVESYADAKVFLEQALNAYHR